MVQTSRRCSTNQMADDQARQECTPSLAVTCVSRLLNKGGRPPLNLPKFEAGKTVARCTIAFNTVIGRVFQQLVSFRPFKEYYA